MVMFSGRFASARFATGVLFCAWAGFSGILFVPLWVAASIEQFGITASFAGRIASLQHLCVAIASFGLVKLVHRFDREKVMLVGMLTIILANLLPVLVPSVPALVMSRGLAGLGEGITLAVMHSMIARHGEPDRYFAVMNFGVTAFAIVAYPLVTPLMNDHGANPVFLVAAAAAVIGLPFSMLLSRSASVSKAEDKDVATPELGGMNRHGIYFLVGMAIFYIGEGALWTYLVRIGLGTGMEFDLVGQTMSIALLFGLVATVLVHYMSARYGRTLPLAFGLLSLCVVALILGHTGDKDVFIYTTYFFYFVFIFVIVYTAAVLAAMDTSGGLVSAAPGARSVGNVIGPVIGSFVVVGGDFQLLGWTAFTFYLVSLFIFVPISLRYDKRIADENTVKDTPT